MTKNVVCATQQEIIPLPSQSTFFNEFLYLCSQIAGLPMICLTFFVTTIDHNFWQIIYTKKMLKIDISMIYYVTKTFRQI